jgi:hypothetical protein
MTMTAQNAQTTAATKKSSAKKWVIGIAATVAVGAGSIGGFVAYLALAHDEPMPTGAHTVEVYTIDDSQTVPSNDGRPFFGMCDASSYYIKAGSAGQCVTLNGSLGQVTATGTKHGTLLDTGAATVAARMIKRDDASAGPATRVLLEYEGAPVAITTLGEMRGGGPVTAIDLDLS